MGVLAALNQAVTATAISSSDYNSNMNNIRSSVNNVTTDQITDGTLLNADISSSAEIALSKLTATASDASLQDALENYLDGCWLYRSSDTVLKVGPGSAMINGELRRISSALSNTPSLTSSKWNDVYLVADSATSVPTLEVVTNQATPGASTASGTNTRLIGSIFSDSANDLNKYINYRNGKVIGWSWIIGDDSNDISEDVVFGVTFEVAPYTRSTMIGKNLTAAPASIDDLTASIGFTAHNSAESTTTGSQVIWIGEVGQTFSSSHYFGFVWSAEGRYT